VNAAITLLKVHNVNLGTAKRSSSQGGGFQFCAKRMHGLYEGLGLLMPEAEAEKRVADEDAVQYMNYALITE
jgi:hypothetical protein